MTRVTLSRSLVSFVIIPAIAVLVTWLTGFWNAGSLSGGDGGYGLPLRWKTVLFLPVCNGCPLPTHYNWEFFLLDSLFYAAIEYCIIIAYLRLRAKNLSAKKMPATSFALVFEK